MIFVGVGDARWFPWRPVDRLGIVLGGCWRCPVVTWSGRPVRVLAGEVARSSGAGWNLGAASLALRALLAVGGTGLPQTFESVEVGLNWVRSAVCADELRVPMACSERPSA